MQAANTAPLFSKTALGIFNTDYPEPEYIVPGIIVQGLTLFVGPPKLGKSWFCLMLALIKSKGGDLLGHFVTSCRILYLSLEDNDRRIKSRIKKLGIIPNDNCTIENRKPEKQWLLALEDYMIQKPDTGLIIIDTLYKFINVQDGNDYIENVRNVSALKIFADKHNISIIIVHHTKKGETGDFVEATLGSTGIAGTADTILKLSRKRGEYDAILNITGRDVEEHDLALKFDTMNCRWSVVGNAQEVAATKERQAILDLLKTAKEPLSPKDIADGLKKSRSTIRVLLMKMKNEGYICVNKSGKYSLTPINSVNSINSNNSINSINSDDYEEGELDFM